MATIKERDKPEVTGRRLRRILGVIDPEKEKIVQERVTTPPQIDENDEARIAARLLGEHIERNGVTDRQAAVIDAVLQREMVYVGQVDYLKVVLRRRNG